MASLPETYAEMKAASEQCDSDIGQLDYTLSLTPRERIEQHGRWLAFVQRLQEASSRRYGPLPRTSEEAE